MASTSATVNKPLPSPPINSPPIKQLASLTVESRAHLRLFLKYALSEENVEGAAAWAKGLELALRELCDALARGAWLAGLKEARKAEQNRMRLKEKECERRQGEKNDGTKDGEKGKCKDEVESEKVAKMNDSVLTGVQVERVQTPDGSKRTQEDRRRLALAQISKTASLPKTPYPGTRPSHLLLTLSPKNVILPPRNLDSDVVAPNKICVFTADKYMLPSAEDWRQGTGGIVLYGLDEWDVDYNETNSEALWLVGGTFSFSGISSITQFHSLTKVLRLSIFVCLSLILEQHILHDSHVHLHFPAGVAAQPLNYSYSAPNVPARPDIIHTSKSSGTGLWSRFARKAENLLNRAAGIPSGVTVARTKSLQVPDSSPPARSRSIELLAPATSTRHVRRLSFSLSSSSRLSSEGERAKQDEALLVLSSAVSRIVSSASILSTSARITFSPPKVLAELAMKEKENPDRKLFGFEKVQLHSLLGWEGRESRGRGMGGLAGFFRHQGISFLYAEYVPLSGFRQETNSTTSSASQTSERDVDELKSAGTESTVSASSVGYSVHTKLVPCERGRWATYRYFKRNADTSGVAKDPDCSLGDFIESLACSRRLEGDERCKNPRCEVQKKDHRRFWIHGGFRISVETLVHQPEESEKDLKLQDERIDVWESCYICQKETERRRMTDGAYLFSFAKFLELLIYSPSLCTLSPSLCTHTTPPPFPWPPHDSPPSTRFNIVRHFLYVGPCNTPLRKVVFRTTEAPALFELCVPRLQLLRGRALDVKPSPKVLDNNASPQERSNQDSTEEKRELRREIKEWWQSLSDHLDKLDERFSDKAIAWKTLPRLPSNDDAFEDDQTPTPKATLAGLPAVASSPPGSHNSENSVDSSSEVTPTPSHAAIISKESLSGASTVSQASRASKNSAAYGKNPSELLSDLRECFQRNEQSLYSLLSKTPNATLNDVRRNFETLSRGAVNRLSAWEQKHIPEQKGRKKRKEAVHIETAEPEWWKQDCHAVPGGSIVVRETELASIIAFTLTSLDYQRELANMTLKGAYSEKTTSSVSQESTSTTSSRTSASTAIMPQTPKPLKPKLVLDPDVNGGDWYEPEAYSATICRQDNPRDPSGLLSLRDVLRQRRTVDFNGSMFTAGSVFSGTRFSPSKFVATISGAPAQRVVSNGTPPSAWAQPAVQVSMQAADGRVTGLPESRGESAEKILQDMEANVENPNNAGMFFSQWKMIRPSSPDPTRRHGLPSRAPAESDSADNGVAGPTVDTLNPGGFLTNPHPTDSIRPTTPTESTAESNESSVASLLLSDHRSSTVTKNTGDSSIQQSVHSQTPTITTLTSTLASTVTNAVKYFLSQDEERRPASPMHHHKLLALDTQAIEDRPHIKYEWTVGKRLKFGCTVYYAKQFEYLRRRCDVEHIFPKSLTRSTNWAAEGGKSRSNFWKTTDDQFVVKTLVNAWNVADLQVLLELAPSYFRYIEGTATRPSVMAKILGFYTIEIKNLETGNVQAKADLLVMENLFYQQKISKAFDLKGIQGRKVKASGSTSDRKTLFDGEWIEDQQKSLILVYPHSKLVLHEAIKADADFLCRNNIMDYSLLLGVDEERRRISCGLVDTIGSYTFAKTLEYKAKQNLNTGREVTVIPPNEYHDRFVSAMNSYFLACPDKWSKPIHDLSSDKIDNDMILPSVL